MLLIALHYSNNCNVDCSRWCQQLWTVLVSTHLPGSDDHQGQSARDICLRGRSYVSLLVTEDHGKLTHERPLYLLFICSF